MQTTPKTIRQRKRQLNKKRKVGKRRGGSEVVMGLNKEMVRRQFQPFCRWWPWLPFVFASRTIRGLFMMNDRRRVGRWKQLREKLPLFGEKSLKLWRRRGG